MKIFNFLNMFRKKRIDSISTVKPTLKHREDDKRQYELFLIELKNLLDSSNLFKKEYVEKYCDLYKNYQPFTGKDYNLVSKQPYFFDSLTEEALKFKKNEIKRYAKNIIFLANRRAYVEVTLSRFQKDNLFKEVTLIFPKNNLICKEMILHKQKYNNKSILISKAPIFPLKSCITCPSCHLGIFYKSNLKI